MNEKQQLLEAKNLVTGYEKKIIVDGIDIAIPSNKSALLLEQMHVVNQLY